MDISRKVIQLETCFFVCLSYFINQLKKNLVLQLCVNIEILAAGTYYKYNPLGQGTDSQRLRLENSRPLPAGDFTCHCLAAMHGPPL